MKRNEYLEVIVFKCLNSPAKMNANQYVPASSTGPSRFYYRSTKLIPFTKTPAPQLRRIYNPIITQNDRLQTTREKDVSSVMSRIAARLNPKNTGPRPLLMKTGILLSESGIAEPRHFSSSEGPGKQNQPLLNTQSLLITPSLRQGILTTFGNQNLKAFCLFF